MDCGKVVLVTFVGAIPDKIKDDKTGFILKINPSEFITRNILLALNCFH